MKKKQSSWEKDEKIRELTITVSGLERVNEAINLRMRELEDQNKELSTRLESGSPEQSDNAQDNNKDEETAKKRALDDALYMASLQAGAKIQTEAP